MNIPDTNAPAYIGHVNPGFGYWWFQTNGRWFLVLPDPVRMPPHYYAWAIAAGLAWGGLLLLGLWWFSWRKGGPLIPVIPLRRRTLLVCNAVVYDKYPVYTGNSGVYNTSATVYGNNVPRGTLEKLENEKVQ